MNARRAEVHALLGAGIAALSFGAIFTRLAEAQPAVVAALRMAFSALLLAAPALGSARIRKELRGLSRGDWGALALAGGFLALHFILWISSLSRTGVAASVVLVTTSPLWIGIYSVVVLRKRLPAVFWGGCALAIAGGAVIAGGGAHQGAMGNLLATGGAIAVAGYFLVGAALRRRLSIVAYVFPVYSIAAIILAAGTIASGGSLAGHAPRTYLYGFLMALVCQAVGHSIFNWALRRIAAADVAVATLGEPVGASILAFLILGEAPGKATAAGGALILVGIVIVLSRGQGAGAAEGPAGSWP